jgi:hypothetical protein
VQQVEGREVGRGLDVQPDAPEVPAAQQLRARRVRHGDRHAEQGVSMHLPEPAQRGEGRVRVGEEVGVTRIERMQ